MLPCEVNLLALFSKLFKTCIRRFFSVFMGQEGESFVCNQLNAAGFRPVTDHAFYFGKDIIQFHVGITEIQCAGSIFDKSSMSLINCSSNVLLLSMILIYSCFSCSSSAVARMFEKPMIAFSGVRISWLILARKADFSRLDSSRGPWLKAVRFPLFSVR